MSYRYGRKRPSAGRQGTARMLLLLAPVWVIALRQLLPALIGAVSSAPDVFVAAVVVAAWQHRPAAAVAFAAAAGCLLDVPSGLPWGITGARASFLACLLISLRGQLALEIPGARWLLVGGAALLDRVLAAVTLKAMVPAVSLEPLLERGCWIALATLPLTPIVFAISSALREEAGHRDD